MQGTWPCMHSLTGSFGSHFNHKALARSSSVEAGTQSFSEPQLIILQSVSAVSRHANQLWRCTRMGSARHQAPLFGSRPMPEQREEIPARLSKAMTCRICQQWRCSPSICYFSHLCKWTTARQMKVGRPQPLFLKCQWGAIFGQQWWEPSRLWS